MNSLAGGMKRNRVIRIVCVLFPNYPTEVFLMHLYRLGSSFAYYSVREKAWATLASGTFR